MQVRVLVQFPLLVSCLSASNLYIRTSPPSARIGIPEPHAYAPVHLRTRDIGTAQVLM